MERTRGRRPIHGRLWMVVAVALVWACGDGATRLASRADFIHPLGKEHPLTGLVWSGKSRRFVTPSELEVALGRARIALLGETHDNADHHVLEAQLLERWLDAHPRGHVAFEMLDEDQAPRIPRLAADPDALADAVGWNRSGWPPFTIYRPVFAVALAARAPIAAAHPSRAQLRAAMRVDVPEPDRRSLRLDPPLEAALRDDLAEEIREGHCGHAMGPMIDAMIVAQRYKDAYMARAVIARGAPVVLIAGRGHVRNDRGVPLYLRRAGAAEVMTVAFVDVRDDAETPAAYDVEAYDFTVFTTRVSDEDPCARFRDQLERIRRGSPRSGRRHGPATSTLGDRA